MCIFLEKQFGLSEETIPGFDRVRMSARGTSTFLCLPHHELFPDFQALSDLSVMINRQ